MKMIKFKKSRFIVVLVWLIISLIILIRYFLKEIYKGGGEYNFASLEFYVLIFLGVIYFFVFFIILVTAIRQKKNVQQINTMMVNIGEDAIALNGAIVDRITARENAKKNALSFLGGMLSALIIGVGISKTYSNNNTRLFILYSEGIYIVDMINNTKYHLSKNDVQNIKITEKRNKLVVELIPLGLTFTVKTKRLDISREELIAKFKEVFTNPMSMTF